MIFMELLQTFKSVTTFVFDLDGVLTDGTFTLLPGGVMARRMNVKDGYALQLAIKKGYSVVVISGSTSEEAVSRLNRLGITQVYMKVLDKVSRLDAYRIEHGLAWAEMLFMGDDIPDKDAMLVCGLACCPNDAVHEIKEVSTFISTLNGGMGCVRDVIEKVMKLKGDWNEDSMIPST